MNETRCRKLYDVKEHANGISSESSGARLAGTRNPSPYSYAKQLKEPFTTKPQPIHPTTLLCLGLSLLVGTILFSVIGIYTVMISSHMPDTGIWILDIIKHDEHYKYLVPSLIPAGLVFVIINWGGLHYFRHA